jgi:hypothetical protein
VGQDHSQPTEELRGYPSLFEQLPDLSGIGYGGHLIRPMQKNYAREGKRRASSSIAFAIGSISCATCLT